MKTAQGKAKHKRMTYPSLSAHESNLTFRFLFEQFAEDAV